MQRGGQLPDVHRKLVAGFCSLIYEDLDLVRTSRHDLSKTVASLDQPAARVAALSDAVNRLANNNVSAVEKFLRDEIARSKRDFSPEESCDLVPRHRPTLRGDETTNRLTRKTLKETDDVNRLVREDEFLTLSPLIDEFASTDLEATVLRLIWNGDSQRDIADGFL